jgi:hypothetical protein
VLIGCRRADDMVRIEVWDSGVGIPGQHIARIFEEYYQVPQGVDPGGVDLGLAIVQRLGKLLSHHVVVRSVPGKGPAFPLKFRRHTKAWMPTRHPEHRLTLRTRNSLARSSSLTMKMMCGARLIACYAQKDSAYYLPHRRTRQSL